MSQRAWLSATLSGSTTPASVKLETKTDSLVAGSYGCSFVVSTAQALVDSALQTVWVSLTLSPVPRLVVSADTVRVSAFRLQDGAPFAIAISNGGDGTIDGLSIGDVSYGAGASNWLAVSLGHSSAPATLTLTPTARGLGPGTYTAMLPLQSSMHGVLNNPTVVPVRFNVSPLPTSGLFTSPNPLRMTVQTGHTASALISAFANGDTPATQMDFTGVVQQNQWAGFSMNCTGGVTIFETPCTLRFDVYAYGMPPGTYTFTAPVKSHTAGFTTIATAILTITP